MVQPQPAVIDRDTYQNAQHALGHREHVSIIGRLNEESDPALPLPPSARRPSRLDVPDQYRPTPGMGPPLPRPATTTADQHPHHRSHRRPPPPHHANVTEHLSCFTPDARFVLLQTRPSHRDLPLGSPSTRPPPPIRSADMIRPDLDRIHLAGTVIDPCSCNSPQYECAPLGEVLGCPTTRMVEPLNPVRNFKRRWPRSSVAAT